MRGSEFLPALNERSETIRAFSVCDPTFDADLPRISSRLTGVPGNSFDRIAAFFIRCEKRKPAIAQPRQAAQRTIVVASEPDRNRALHRQRVQTRIGDLMPSALKGDQFFSP